MLRIEHLTKKYGDKKAVDDLSLHIQKGEIYGFIGHNGAGKTTTIKSCCGILNFDEGEIYVDGVSVKEKPLECKRKIAYIPDNPDLYEFMTGIKYLNFIADIFGISQSDRQAIQDEISQLTTEIDRVAETTKFNETYLLKGGDDTKDVYMNGHDAGLKGTLTDSATSATFKVAAGALDAGKKVTIGGKEYTIGGSEADAEKLTAAAAAAGAKADQTIQIDGATYTYKKDNTKWVDAKGQEVANIDGKIVKGSTVTYGDKTVTVLNDNKKTGIDDADSTVISADNDSRINCRQ